jgi:hypothetical protein
MSTFAALSAINEPLAFAMLFLFFVTIWLGKKTFRPGLSTQIRRCPSLFLSPPAVLYIPIDVCGGYFSTSRRMCSAPSCTSGMYLRVWGWVGRVFRQRASSLNDL